MQPKRPLSGFDIAGIVAASLVTVGVFLPFWVFNFSGWGSISASFREASGGDLALLLGIGAIVLVAVRARVAAILSLVVVGLIVSWQVLDVGFGSGLSPGAGAAVLPVGVIGGVIVLAVARKREGSAARVSDSTRVPEASEPPDIIPGPGPGKARPVVDPDDPFRIVTWK